MEPYRILFSEQQINQRIRQLAKLVDQHYQEEPLVLVSMLKGSIYFLADVSRAIRNPAEIDVVAVSSSDARMRLTRDITVVLQDKHVLILEEIVRTGLTTNFLIQHLETKNPKSLAVCALLANEEQQLIALPLHFIGFPIDQTRVVGYGMDYREHDRTLPFIAELVKDRYR